MNGLTTEHQGSGLITMDQEVKQVVIKGVSSGLGWDVTKALLGQGFHVFGSVRTQESALVPLLPSFPPSLTRSPPSPDAP